MKFTSHFLWTGYIAVWSVCVLPSCLTTVYDHLGITESVRIMIMLIMPWLGITYIHRPILLGVTRVISIDRWSVVFFLRGCIVCHLFLEWFPRTGTKRFWHGRVSCAPHDRHMLGPSCWSDDVMPLAFVPTFLFCVLVWSFLSYVWYVLLSLAFWLDQNTQVDNLMFLHRLINSQYNFIDIIKSIPPKLA